ncbi:MAG: hypothetical protein EBT98_12535, partial [Opitutaceae bacterium]|nr:hypothetical protein [Opitutaceae bacterium]
SVDTGTAPVWSHYRGIPAPAPIVFINQTSPIDRYQSFAARARRAGEAKGREALSVAREARATGRAPRCVNMFLSLSVRGSRAGLRY